MTAVALYGSKGRRKGELTCHILVDDLDMPLIKAHNWYFDGTYVARRVMGKKIYLHRELLELERGDLRQGEHIDRNKLNCQRSNLRVVSNQLENMQNRHSVPGSSSRYRGVTWYRRDGRWAAQAMLNRRRIHLGYFDDEDEASRVVSEWRAAHMPFSSDAGVLK